MQYQPDIEFRLGANRVERQPSTRDHPLEEQSVAVLDQPIWDGTPQEAIALCLDGKRKTVCFLNAHCANVRARHRSYAQALGRADYVFPDGIGVELAARMTGTRLTANLNGTDLVPAMLQEAGQRGLSVYLLGAKPGVAQAAAEKLEASCPGLTIAGVRDGYGQSKCARSTVDAINTSGADIVLVAMGVPLQELWIDQFRDELDAQLVMGVGALFDFVSGMMPRAPEPVRKMRAEWVYRLCMEPRRMAGRYLVGNATFMTRAMVHSLKGMQAGAVEKRMLDIVLALVALCLLAPLFLVILLAIRLDSRGQAVFSQMRVGEFGAEFKLFKFRTMYVDAEARRAALLKTSDRSGVCFKSKHDPRVTRAGRFLRKWSFDELPQIINVLKGDMSLVGPRPALPSEVQAYPPRAMQRLMTKPGITGVWQVSGRADISFDKMVDLDIAYVKARTIWLDLMVMALTFRAVLLRQGAY
ncbi:putative sugar transferase EpsL [Pelagimonas phthalicica]|uniref:Putative sugar transferase EpsL n=1 Tax=Pelagimonas phthalicica TaxID=1037362 RepID=A0A238JHN7_9RHOB|nr:WecB/TagA/CpsF family glycosyltransferase [Pelagimonas phthalicica]TDS92275.1 exopolysaccharide biosynthesis WecB/TagA/CpsF family protein [Pelagimonas phthalicica]SMX29336.1 putative sugar transferase EpsL [Pelagimonas phthalicica]